MTETTSRRRAVSEITRADYRAITDAAYDLSLLIHGFMGRMEDGAKDPAWHELHELSQLAHVTATAAGRYADRAGLPSEPVDYRPAAAHGQPRHRYDAMTCDDCAAIVVPS